MRKLMLLVALCVIVQTSIITVRNAEADDVVYYMPYLSTDSNASVSCMVANKTATTVATTIQIMSGMGATPTQNELGTINVAAKRSKMITFSGTSITAYPNDPTIIDIRSEVGSGSTSYSADITFSSTDTLDCITLGMTCFQGTTSPKRNLVGYFCYDGNVHSF
jgi:hypothetical protein